jgi:hypothetical protein
VVRPGPLLALAAVAVVIGVQRSVAGAALGLVGTVLGALAGLAALQLGMLAGALASGARVHNVVIGVGRRWAEWVTPRRTIALRGLPILLSVAVGPGRPPLRLRMWAAALASAVAGLGAVVLLWLVALPVSFGLWLGAALGATAVVVHALLPRQDATSTSTGWLLTGLPRMPADELADLRASALVDDALVALRSGRLDAAEAACTELAQRFPGSRAAGTTRVSVLHAQGRYGLALAATLELAADPDLSPRDAAYTFAALASLAAAAVEAGEVPADAALPIARQALEDATRLGYPPYKLDGTRALLALLDGDTTTAARLARTAADTGDHPLSRADDLATLARALMASGDNRAARAALAEASALAPWWPRVAATQARLNL